MTRHRKPNAFGREWLADVQVQVIYPNDGPVIEFELQVEPNIILCGSKWRPGVSYNTNAYGHHPFTDAPIDIDDGLIDVGEIIAYAINEGGVSSDEIAGYKGEARITWQVLNPEILRHWDIIRD